MNILMDAYNTSRVDIQRGPNSILYGLGARRASSTTRSSDPGLDKLATEVQFRVDSYGSHREILDVDVPLVSNTPWPARSSASTMTASINQDDTFNHDQRIYGALRWQPKSSPRIFTQIDIKGEAGKIDGNRPVAVTPSDFISNWFGPLNRYLTYNPLTNNGVPQDPSGASHPELSHYFAGAPARDWWNDSPADDLPERGRQRRSATATWTLTANVMASRGAASAGVTNRELGRRRLRPVEQEPGVILRRQRHRHGDHQRFSKGDRQDLQRPAELVADPGDPQRPADLRGPDDGDRTRASGTTSRRSTLTPRRPNWRLGLNAAYDKQSYRLGYANAISTTRVTVDVNATLRDGSANPDVGRPMILGPSAGGMTEEDREAYRITGFYKFNLKWISCLRKHPHEDLWRTGLHRRVCQPEVMRTSIATSISTLGTRRITAPVLSPRRASRTRARATGGAGERRAVRRWRRRSARGSEFLQDDSAAFTLRREREEERSRSRRSQAHAPG